MDGRGLTGRTSRRAVWVTRAAPAAARTARAVAALGFEPIVEPLIEVRRLPVPPPELAGVGALAFTSAAGVRAFAALHPGRDLPVFAVGSATAQEAQAAGWRRVTSADGDVAALDARLAAEAPPGRVLAPGALHPAGRLDHAERLAVYDTAPAAGPWPRARAALGAGDLRAVLLHSPSAARALAASGLCAPRAEALALSRACAAPLRAERWGAVRVADRPEEPALLALLGHAPGAPPPWQGPPSPL